MEGLVAQAFYFLGTHFLSNGCNALPHDLDGLAGRLESIRDLLDDLRPNLEQFAQSLVLTTVSVS